MNKTPTWAKQAPRSVADPRVRYRLANLGGLHSAMVARGFTSGYQLAQAAGLSASTVNHIVHGRRKTASATTVHQLRTALGDDIDALFQLDKCTIHVNRAA